MSVGLLDFFVLEASDYIDRLQRLVASDEPMGPDSATLLKLARGLRGSAVMARLTSFADAASGLERGARLLHEGRIAWTPGLAAAVTDSIADLKSLVPMARLWGESQDLRARSTGGKLGSVLDAVERHGELMQSGAMPPSRPTDPAEPNSAVAAFFDSIDQAANAPAVPSPMSSPVPPMPVAMRSAESASAVSPPRGLSAMSDASMTIVPIASLASSNDLDAVVYRAPNPPVTFAQRFITDVSPLIASLRARLAPLRHGTSTQEASADMMAAFRPVLVSLRDTASSYQHEDIRAFCDAVLTAQAPLPAPSAGALDTALTVILQQDLAAHLRAQRLAELRRVVLASTPLSSGASSEAASRPNGAFTPRTRTPVTATIIPTPTTMRPTPPAPSGRELNSLLSSSLEKVRELDATPLDLLAIADSSAPPASAGPDGEPDVVPIDSLLYRGPRALSRARHIVGQLRGAGDAHDAALISELFDLVELAGSAT
ncbi:MAG: Hpt domain-containing protein [Gemmatimonadaceae bacterium]|nr:Hpt domain-containing protein [Gemmatimonadaceae bacterium]